MDPVCSETKEAENKNSFEVLDVYSCLNGRFHEQRTSIHCSSNKRISGQE